MVLSTMNLAKAFESNHEVVHDAEASNSDLVWDMARFEQRLLAQQLMLRFEKRLCIYSPSVHQIYTNFNVFFPKGVGEKMLILPNPFAHHDIFFNVPEDAVRPTGLMIVPDYYSEDAQPLLRIPLKNQRDPFRFMPLMVGLKMLNSRRPVEQPLLPILAKGDLKELADGVPGLHLHSLSLPRLSALSPMDISSLRSAITEKLQMNA